MPDPAAPGAVPAIVDHVFRRHAAQLVAALTRAIGVRHLSLVEDSVQDALVTALQRWPYQGEPADHAAWLFRVARNRAFDRLRHQRIVVERAPAVREVFAQDVPPLAALLASEMPPLDDDQLDMMFMTCHPVLPREMRVALTLKIVGGFSVREIARAFLTQETAISQRLVRGKRILRERDVQFGSPGAAEISERLESVLEAIYLMFNEGYAATTGDVLIREDISAEAIRLARLVTRHPATATPQAWALLALLLLHAARFKARVSSEGELFLLRDQDRSKWDRSLVAEGLRAMDRAASGDVVSPYHLEAEIAACHAVAADWHATDWQRILDCYDQLFALTGSPIVALNRGIARARVEGTRAAIVDIEEIGDAPLLQAYHLLPAVLAELWREAGDADRAAGYYQRALALTQSAPERRFLAARLEGLPR